MLPAAWPMHDAKIQILTPLYEQAHGHMRTQGLQGGPARTHAHTQADVQTHFACRRAHTHTHNYNCRRPHDLQEACVQDVRGFSTRKHVYVVPVQLALRARVLHCQHAVTLLVSLLPPLRQRQQQQLLRCARAVQP